MIKTRNKINIKVVVFGTNANGEPDFYFCKIRTTLNNYNLGIHYDRACDEAVNNGYEGLQSINFQGGCGLLAVDENDNLFRNLDLENKVDWNTASIFEIGQ